MSSFLFYCKPGNISDPVDYAASAQMRRVRSGDEVWLVSSERRQLFLEGHLRVESVVGRAEAEARLGRANLWDAPLYALALTGSAEATKKVDISTLANELAFEGRPSRLPAGGGCRASGRCGR